MVQSWYNFKKSTTHTHFAHVSKSVCVYKGRSAILSVPARTKGEWRCNYVDTTPAILFHFVGDGINVVRVVENFFVGDEKFSSATKKPTVFPSPPTKKYSFFVVLGEMKKCDRGRVRRYNIEVAPPAGDELGKPTFLRDLEVCSAACRQDLSAMQWVLGSEVCHDSELCDSAALGLLESWPQFSGMRGRASFLRYTDPDAIMGVCLKVSELLGDFVAIGIRPPGLNTSTLWENDIAQIRTEMNEIVQIGAERNGFLESGLGRGAGRAGVSSRSLAD